MKAKHQKDRNYVHKYMEEFNKSKTHPDKKNDYKRPPKHKVVEEATNES